jgi:hypothetical protein
LMGRQLLLVIYTQIRYSTKAFDLYIIYAREHGVHIWVALEKGASPQLVYILRASLGIFYKKNVRGFFSVNLVFFL